MNTAIRFLVPVTGLFLLAACGQPESGQQESAAAPAETVSTDAAPATEEQREIVQSIDADGNVAPFGMASRKPVPLEDAPAATVAADSGASSELYGLHCQACHGADAKGVQGLGLSLVDSALVASSSQDQLSEFLKAGRAADSPDSVSGVPMPAFAWMSDEQLADITGYLKSLNN